MLSTMGKYIINVVDMRSEEPWEGKSMCVFYLDLFTGIFQKDMINGMIFTLFHIRLLQVDHLYRLLCLHLLLLSTTIAYHPRRVCDSTFIHPEMS